MRGIDAEKHVPSASVEVTVSAPPCASRICSATMVMVCSCALSDKHTRSTRRPTSGLLRVREALHAEANSENREAIERTDTPVELHDVARTIGEGDL